jgi:hypothetical protein
MNHINPTTSRPLIVAVAKRYPAPWLCDLAICTNVTHDESLSNDRRSGGTVYTTEMSARIPEGLVPQIVGAVQ